MSQAGQSPDNSAGGFVAAGTGYAVRQLVEIYLF